MTTGQGKTITLTMQTLPDSRGYQYCELVFNYGDKGSDIYSTSPLAKANLDWKPHLEGWKAGVPTRGPGRPRLRLARTQNAGGGQ